MKFLIFIIFIFFHKTYISFKAIITTDLVDQVKKDHLECPACGSKNPPDVDRCEICGSLVDLDEEEKQVLDNLKRIPDVGMARAEKVVIAGLSRVKDLERMEKEELASIQGIGSTTAEKIYDFIQDVKDEEGRLKICGTCGTLMGADLEECPRCEERAKRGKKNKEEEADIRESTGGTEELSPKVCSVCGTSIENAEDECPVCGKPLSDQEPSGREGKEKEGSEGERVCAICGTPLKEGMDRCPICKSSQVKIEPEEEDITKTDLPSGEERLKVDDVKDSEGKKADQFFDDVELVEGECEDGIEEKRGSEGVEMSDGSKGFEEIEGPEPVEETEQVEGVRKTEEREHHEELEGPEKKWKRHEGYPGELEEDKAYIKGVLENIEDEIIDMTPIEERLKILSSHEERGEYDKALEISLELVLDVEDLQDLEDHLSDLGSTRRKVSTDGAAEEFKSELKRIEEKCREGEYSRALEIAKILKNIPTSEEEKKLESDFKERLMKIRENMRIARETGLDLKNIKREVKEALELGKSGELVESLKILNKELVSIQKVLLFSSILEGAKEELREIRELGVETSASSQELKEIKEKANGGDLDQALKEIYQLFRVLEKKKREIQN